MICLSSNIIDTRAAAAEEDDQKCHGTGFVRQWVGRRKKKALELGRQVTLLFCDSHTSSAITFLPFSSSSFPAAAEARRLSRVRYSLVVFSSGRKRKRKEEEEEEVSD